MNKLSIIITCYNEAKTIEEVISRISRVVLPKEITKKEIVIVDDCSTDNSRNILKDIEQKRAEATDPSLDVKFIYQQKNTGKGGALRTGIKEAIGDFIIFQDADMELDPDEIIKLFGPILSGEADMALGSRFLGKTRQYLTKNYFKYLVANKIINLIFNVLYLPHLTDVNCGYKLFKKEVIKGINLVSDQFEIEVEIIAKVLKKGYKIREVPVSYTPRTVMQGKKIRARHAFRMINTMIKFRFVD